jgi:hypothetical protein
MSAELYDSGGNLERGSSCGLGMNARGYLFLTCYEGGSDAGNAEGIATCVLAPNEKGFAEAERLAAALLEWVRHSKGVEVEVTKDHACCSASVGSRGDQGTRG